ncbi:MAG: hydroxyacylglutathione hydrolase [Dasania sp.]|jgi:hydroxyacylglutathione hydrolase
MEIVILDCQNALKNYAFIIIDDNNRDCALIDTVDTHIIVDYLQEHHLNLKYILNTHHHNDHIGGNLHLKSLYDCQIFGNKHDQERINGITNPVNECDIIALFDNKLQFQVMNFDGHTMGHIGFYAKKQQWLFSGDTIFNLGCGRRFEGTSEVFYQTLKSIANLPEDTLIYAAHEYTLDNITFAKSVMPQNHPDYQAFLNYCDLQKAKRTNNTPTIPFNVQSQKKFNPFLLCDNVAIKNCISNNAMLEASEIFSIMRTLKDNF